MGTPVRRSSRGRISWSSMKRTTLVTSQVTTTTARAERIALTVIVTSPALTLASATTSAMRSRSSSAECASVNTKTPVVQQNSRTTRCSACSIASPRSRTLRRLRTSGMASETRKDLIEHPCQRGKDQPEPRGDDRQRGQRARDTRVAKRARDNSDGQYQQHRLHQSAQQNGGHAGHQPRESSPAPIVQPAPRRTAGAE